jgi:hypothetical protein
MMERQLIIVGEGVVQSLNAAAPAYLVERVATCEEVRRLLRRTSGTDLILTSAKLPDGNWCDVLRMVVERRVSSEVRVVDQDGRTALRFEVRRSRCSVKLTQPSVSLQQYAAAS